LANSGEKVANISDVVFLLGLDSQAESVFYFTRGRHLLICQAMQACSHVMTFLISHGVDRTRDKKSMRSFIERVTELVTSHPDLEVDRFLGSVSFVKRLEGVFHWRIEHVAQVVDVVVQGLLVN